MQTQGRELIFHGNSAAPADRYTLIRRMPSLPDSPPAIVVAEVGGQRWLVAQSYKVGGWSTASPGLAQLYYGLHAIVQAGACGNARNGNALRQAIATPPPGLSTVSGGTIQVSSWRSFRIARE